MKAKKIIERILKVINILMNIIMGFIGFTQYCNYGIDGYMYSDTIYRIAWIIFMAITVNGIDIWVRKQIREF